MLVYKRLEWDFFMNLKFAFLLVLDRINYRCSLNVGTKIYLTLVKFFYANVKKKGTKEVELHTTYVEGSKFYLTFGTLEYEPLIECVIACFETYSRFPINLDKTELCIT